MNFKKLLDVEHSKELTNRIVEHVINNPNKMGDLVDLMINANPRIRQRAAWPLSMIAQKDPAILKPHLPELCKELKAKNNHPAINRNILRALQYIDIPNKYHSLVIDNSFRLLNSHDEPVAIKVFGMQVLFNLTKYHPDLKNELVASIEQQWNNTSVGFKSRGRKILKSLKSN
ncbi:MAG: hypothetical protein HKN22_06415 [Bacteroidia bacterium]|nr:hypothetical protein [Bacteroidia bacterium]